LGEIDIARRSTKGSVALFTGNFFSTIVAAISAIIIARLLGPDNYGSYTLALLIPNILVGLLGLGVATGVTRFAAYHSSRGERAVALRMTLNGVYFLLAFGVVLTLFSYVAADYLSSTILHRPELTPLAKVASLAIVSQGIVTTAISALLGWNAMGRVGLLSVIHAIVKLAIGTTLVVLGFGVLGALVGLISAYFLVGGAGLAFLYTLSSNIKGGGVRAFIADNAAMLRYGFPHQVGGIVASFSAQFVTIILAAIATDAVVGFYQAASNFASAVSLTSSAVTLTLLPAFAHLEGIQADTGLAFKYSVKYMAFLVSPVIFLLAAAARPMMQLLYGPAYGGADTYLVLLAVSNLPLLIGHVILPVFFAGIGRTRLSMVFNVVGSAFQIAFAPILGIWLNLGVPGLIYSILLSGLAASILGLYLAQSKLKATVDLKGILRVLLASLISFAALYPLGALHLHPSALLAADCFLFAFVYLTSVPLIGAVTQADLIRLRVATEELGPISKVVKLVLDYEGRVLKIRSS
jgi:O-antigen/teichoic acid export membrane protein